MKSSISLIEDIKTSKFFYLYSVIVLVSIIYFTLDSKLLVSYAHTFMDFAFEAPNLNPMKYIETSSFTLINILAYLFYFYLIINSGHIIGRYFFENHMFLKSVFFGLIFHITALRFVSFIIPIEHIYLGISFIHISIFILSSIKAKRLSLYLPRFSSYIDLFLFLTTFLFSCILSFYTVDHPFSGNGDYFVVFLEENRFYRSLNMRVFNSHYLETLLHLPLNFKERISPVILTWFSRNFLKTSVLLLIYKSFKNQNKSIDFNWLIVTLFLFIGNYSLAFNQTITHFDSHSPIIYGLSISRSIAIAYLIITYKYFLNIRLPFTVKNYAFISLLIIYFSIGYTSSSINFLYMLCILPAVFVIDKTNKLSSLLSIACLIILFISGYHYSTYPGIFLFGISILTVIYTSFFTNYKILKFEYIKYLIWVLFIFTIINSITGGIFVTSAYNLLGLNDYLITNGLWDNQMTINLFDRIANTHWPNQLTANSRDILISYGFIAFIVGFSFFVKSSKNSIKQSFIRDAFIPIFTGTIFFLGFTSGTINIPRAYWRSRLNEDPTIIILLFSCIIIYQSREIWKKRIVSCFLTAGIISFLHTSEMIEQFIYNLNYIIKTFL